MYNVTALNEGSTIVDFIAAINTTSSYLVANLILFLIALVLLISISKVNSFQKALVTTGIITTLIAILFWGMQWIKFGTIFYPIVIFLGGLIWMALGGSE